MADEEEPATFVIAGGGIVGLALAMTIKKQLGIVPEIYEKATTFATEAGAGLGMYPNGLRVLRDINPELLTCVRSSGYPYKCRHWERHNGEEVMKAEESVLSGEESELDSIGIRRSTLQRVLLMFATMEGITIRYKKPLVSAEQQNDGLVKVTFGDGSTRLTQVLFGADGALGKSRSIVAGKDEPALKYTGTTCLMGLANVKCDGIYFPSSDKENFHAVFFPTRVKETCFQFHMPVTEDEANALNWGNLSDSVGQKECQKIAKQLRAEGWHEKFIKPLDNCIHAVRVGFALLEPKLNTWVKGRVALVGDACHPPVPYVGQGAQQGLEDAGVAVALMKIYCIDEKTGKFDPTNFEKAMRVYQEIRTVRASQILDISKALGKMQSDRAGLGIEKNAEDEILKGEVLMYGTLPVMSSGASHNYRDDIIRATSENYLPTVDVDVALEAMEYILGKASNEANRVESERNGKLVESRKHFVDQAYGIPSNRVELLVDWIYRTLERLLRRVVAHRNAKANFTARQGRMRCVGKSCGASIVDERTFSNHVPLGDLSEIIEIPVFNPDVDKLEEDPMSIVLPPEVGQQLREFVVHIASLYHNNPFHNFEHSASVTMSMHKLLSRMTSEKSSLAVPDPTGKSQAYGISTDPMTQFACIFASLLHDADHDGVPNTQLAKEHPEMDKLYEGQALAEQNSLDKAWAYFLLPKNTMLRRTIYGDEAEMNQFRHLVTNLVIATDICSKEMRAFREARIQKAFSEEHNDSDIEENIQRRATIGVEYLIQASDVCHTMQPWNAYRQWNRRLYHEMYRAFKEGRSSKDPSEFWYQGEKAFFNFYIIPLAKKLKKFEVFGSVCDEFLLCAEKNLQEWEFQGQGIVKEMIAEVEQQWSTTIAA
ncbi:hydroxynicotinate 3-monooxygenase [Seminavis robusta]|uniref:Hydroxynicotinate 3-monooxygenase n=1 Tax=Seminavis robusta TaxID=568900 RepID=A0A9N8DDK3_9STRA|nr:hydroxynicotinate 3-monooxygenase [Seminavis robusta]|eukprot:Sro89_g046990.1 hydroxynicotinate 3-monooxygenase (883) ;mRNA; f:73034-76565